MSSALELTDQMGRLLSLPARPGKIISLVPSQTELLCDLGLEPLLVGVTKFCIHPAHIRKEKTIVGGTKQLRMDVIDRLAPDLIIGNKEENEKHSIKVLAARYPVWMSDIADLAGSVEMIRHLAGIGGVKRKGEMLTSSMISEFGKLPEFEPLRTLYLIWRNPYMAAGQNTFINEMMKKGGFANIMASERYPELTEERIRKLNPELVLLSSEPYPFAEKHKEELKRLLPETDVLLVDGELFSWYGSRLLKLPRYLEGLRTMMKK